MSNTNEEFTSRLCPHRGVGKENTVESIRSGIALNPFFVEFDIQYYHSTLHLGHPPEVNAQSTLADALSLYSGSSSMPKVDMRLGLLDSNIAMKLLIAELDEWGTNEILINIAGVLDSHAYMQAESTLIDNTRDSVLLNIDLERYEPQTIADIETHVKNLNRKPFSLSPNLEDNIFEAIDFAKQFDISHLHFWSHFDHTYTYDHLSGIMKTILDSGLEVYFDIKLQNITP